MTSLPSRLIGLLLLLSTFLLHAQQEMYDEVLNTKTGTRLTVTAMTDHLPSLGYFAVRVSAINNEKLPITWTFDFLSLDYSYSGSDSNQLSSTFSLTCEPNRRATSEFIVPLVTCFNGSSYSAEANLKLSIDARPPFGGRSAFLSSEYEEGKPQILISETLYTPNKGTLDAISWPTVSGRSGMSFGGQIDPKMLSEDWRSYLGYDNFMLTVEDWRNCSPGAQSAIKKWARLGGHLLLFSPSSEDTLTSLAIDETPETPTATDYSWGKVELLNLPNSNILNALEVEHTISAGKTKPKLAALTDDYLQNWPLQQNFGNRDFNPLFFILILLAFAIIVGPINLFVFAKSGQRHKLFITTPIISLAASLLLIVVILFQDGFGGKGQRLTLMEIRPEDNIALVLQQQITRTGVLLSTSFSVKNNAHLTPLMLDENRWTRVKRSNNGGGGRYRLSPDSSTTTNHSGDWFKSRSEYGHLITTIQPTRGRLELASPNGPPILTSTFDFPIDTLYYIDSSGGYWKGQNLKSGKRLTLTPSNDIEFDKWIMPIYGKLDLGNSYKLKSCANRQAHFIALSSKAPQIATLKSLNWPENTTIITGPVKN